MDLNNIIYRNVPPNFLNLSLLICQLFAGGKFRTAHILYHPDAVDNDLLNAIDASCPFQIPKMTFDISTALSSPSDPNQRTDHILQLIFLPKIDLTTSMNRIQHLLTFYRVFIFSANEQPESQLGIEWMEESKLISNVNSSSFLLIHNRSNGIIQSYLLTKNHHHVSMEPIDMHKNHLKSEIDIFNVALGEKAYNQHYGVCEVEMIICHSSSTIFSRTFFRKFIIFGNIYSTRFNMSFVDYTSMHCNNVGFDVDHKYVQPIRKSSYSDLSTDFKPITLDSK